jgi:hypothetical protein
LVELWAPKNGNAPSTSDFQVEANGSLRSPPIMSNLDDLPTTFDLEVQVHRMVVNTFNTINML